MQIQSKLQEKIQNAVYYLLALDESNDLKITAQLMIFIGGISSTFEIFEEMPTIRHMRGRATGRHILNSFL